MILLIGAGLGNPLMLANDVVGVITVGVDGRAVRSAKATVPFLARFTRQGVAVGPGNPWIVRCKTAVPSGAQPFEQVCVIVHCPGLVGVP